MVGRLLRNLFAALLVVALIAVPAFALQGSGLLGAPQVVPQTEPDQPAVTTEDEGDGEAGCHGIQRAYWAVTGNPGVGEGKEEAAAALVAEANERGCELADAPGNWPGGRPDWAGGPPAWAGSDDDGDNGNGPPWAEGDGPPWGPPPWAGEGRGERGGNGEGRGGPKWATEGDGPPWGMAWGYWLDNQGLERVCTRIAARMEAHPDATVPEDLRGRIESELGCNLP